MDVGLEKCNIVTAWLGTYYYSRLLENIKSYSPISARFKYIELLVINYSPTAIPH